MILSAMRMKQFKSEIQTSYLVSYFVAGVITASLSKSCITENVNGQRNKNALSFSQVEIFGNPSSAMGCHRFGI
jgi:hypothetical protein